MILSPWMGPLLRIIGAHVTGQPLIMTLLSTLERIQCLYKHLQESIALHVPLKTLRQTGKLGEPWFTRELDLPNVEKDRRHRRYKRTWDPTDLQLFRDARTKALVAIESTKQLYYYERFKTLYDSKLLWNELRNLGLCSTGLDAPSIFSAEQLNQYFAIYPMTLSLT